jgi:phage gp36-like protein
MSDSTNTALSTDDIDFISKATQLAVNLLTKQTLADPQDIKRAHQALQDAAAHLQTTIGADKLMQPMTTCAQCYINYLENHNFAQYEACLLICTG